MPWIQRTKFFSGRALLFLDQRNLSTPSWHWIECENMSEGRCACLWLRAFWRTPFNRSALISPLGIRAWNVAAERDPSAKGLSKQVHKCELFLKRALHGSFLTAQCDSDLTAQVSYDLRFSFHCWSFARCNTKRKGGENALKLLATGCHVYSCEPAVGKVRDGEVNHA